MWIGVDIGGSSIKAGVVDAAGKIHQWRETQTPEDPQAVIGTVVDCVRYFQKKQSADIVAIGVGVPGIVDDDGVVYYPPNLPQWSQEPLQQMLRSEFSIPLWVENDANVAAIGEMVWGKGRNLDSFLYITWGTGIGGGIILNRSLWKGAGWAGEIGHTIINISQPYDQEQGFRTGTVEALVGRRGIEIIASIAYLQFNGEKRSISGAELNEGFQKNQLWAIAALSKIAEYMGCAVATWCTILGIENVIIGGGFSNFQIAVFEQIRNVIRLRALPIVRDRIVLHRAQLLERTGVIGAAAYAKHRYEQLNTQKERENEND